MVSTLTPVCEFGLPAPDFELPGIDGNTTALPMSAAPTACW